MQTSLECIPCFIRQTIEVLHLVAPEKALKEEILRHVLKLLNEVNFSESPPQIAAKIHRLIRKMGHEEDPYRRLKHMFNQIASSLYPQMKEEVISSQYPFGTAVRVAVAGNCMDCALVTDLDLADIHRSLREALKAHMSVNSIAQLSAAVDAADRILYIADNAGEIVFDRILLEEMHPEKVTFAVRGYPVLNDATMEDAIATELSDLVTVVDNGSDIPGTVLGECSQRFREHFMDADLVIAKGQGNYETLNTNGKPIFFLFKAKCPVVAREMGCSQGMPVISRTNPEMRGGEMYA
jgi:uncharacterized protein with ATP-grasp and redox domains